jgi:hypothetical protein
VAAVRRYRELAFFRTDAHLSDEALAAAPDARYRTVKLTVPCSELALQAPDAVRV